jgi:hypothetical protein
MTLWVDGVILAQAGTPGNSLESMTAGTNYLLLHRTSQPPLSRSKLITTSKLQRSDRHTGRVCENLSFAYLAPQKMA